MEKVTSGGTLPNWISSATIVVTVALGVVVADFLELDMVGHVLVTFGLLAIFGTALDLVLN